MRAIARLEARLRVPLLQRSTQGASLTDVGGAYGRLRAPGRRGGRASLGQFACAGPGTLRVFLPFLFSCHVMAPVWASWQRTAILMYTCSGALPRLLPEPA